MNRSADPQPVDPGDAPRLWQLSFARTRRGISVVDPNTKIVRLVNPAFAAMHGGEPEQFVGQPLASVFAPSSVPLIPEVSRELREGYISYDAEHVRLDGTVFPVAIEVMTAHDEITGNLHRVAWYTDLTEQRHIERERDQARRRFEAAFANAPAGMALLDLDDHWLAINRALCEITGYSKAELQSLSFAAISHPEDADNDLAQYERLLRGELDAYTIEKRYLGKDGEVIWALASVSLVRDEASAPQNLIVQIQDISERKRMEEELTHAARGFELARDLLCTATFDGRLDRINGSWKEVLGWSDDELRAHGFLHFVHPEDRARTLAEVESYSEGGASHRFRNRWITKDGGSVWLEWTAIGILTEGRVFCVAREVNEAIVIEQALELQAAIAANMAEGVCLIRVDDVEIVYANPKFEQMMGYAEGDMVGMTATDAMLPAEEALDAQTEEEIRGLIDTHGSATYEARRLRKDGVSIWCRVTTSKLDHAEYGEIWIIVQYDISEERRLRELRGELERSKDSFFSAVTHELRTPLTSILGYVEILKEDAANLGPEGDEALEIIERNASRQLRLVEDVLSIASDQGTEFELELEPVDLAVIVRDAAAALRPVCEQKEVTVRLELDPAPEISGDPDRLGQVFSNLLSNAIKFTPSGGTITVGLRAADGGAAVTVADTGPGIDATERGRVFERFYRGEQANRMKVPGAGLGLAIADSIVQAHGGVIRVRDDEGPGAVFEVSLPTEDSGVAEPAA